MQLLSVLISFVSQNVMKRTSQAVYVKVPLRRVRLHILSMCL